MNDPSSPRAGLATERRIQVVSLAILAAVALAGALYWLRPVMIPFVLALLCTHGLTPLVDALVRRMRVPRWAAILLALLFVAVGFTALGLLVNDSMRQLGDNRGAYQARLDALMADGALWLRAQGVNVDPSGLTDLLGGAGAGDVLGKLTGALVAILSNTFLVLVFSIYLLTGHEGDPAPRSAAPPVGLRATIETRVRKYLVLKLLLSLATGAAVGLTLLLLGVDLALLFGVLAVVLNFVPTLGSIIATLLPLPVVLVDPSAGGWTIALVLLIPATLQIIVGNVLEPKLMGDLLELHPITVLLALIFWGMLWGLPGMLLAAPLTAIIKLLLEPMALTAPLARLMAGGLPPREAAAPGGQD